MSKTSSAVKRRYNRKNYDSISMMQPKGWKAAVQAAASAEDKSLAGYIREAVEEKMGRDERHETL